MRLTHEQVQVLRRILVWLREGHRLLSIIRPHASETLSLGIAVDELHAILRSEDSTAQQKTPSTPARGT